MNSFPEDLLAIILSKLPIKIFTALKLVCKQWKSIVESPYFRDLFQSMDQNSDSSSWSLMHYGNEKEVIAHYRFNTWGLERSLGSYITSFLTKKFESQRNNYRVWAYSTDAGLILISEVPMHVNNRSLYVANPVSQECVKIPPHHKGDSCPLGIATRTENGVLLDYKVVLFGHSDEESLLIYSSETGLWTFDTVHLSLFGFYNQTPISLHGSIHWIATNGNQDHVAVSIDFYATGTSSVQGRVTSLPDSGQQFDRSFSTCQGSLMYMRIVSVTKADGTVEDKLCVWRLKSGEWQLVSTFIYTGLKYFPMGINPFDANTIYFWSKEDRSLLSFNVRNEKFVLERKLKHSRDLTGSFFSSFVLPQWLHKIPKTVRE
ncbi:PREDICTED: putative F-box protein At3g28280 [Camelina sativa]|uniref:F-box protein At3g28280 n=1 Tax=Camelina sativa TaxID=90675 RepID=A0ABM0TSZ3_CAMSA|nr:PREDICTED: putative F-box protein At3g28280 [Camelina sativa]